jgi:acyl-CoA synthetase (NDP forming)
VSIDLARVRGLLEGARHRATGILTEPEGMDLLEAAGIPVPRRLVLTGAGEAARLGAPPFAGERAVLKVVAPHILHKTEARGVAVVPNTPEAIRAELAEMERRFSGHEVDGYLLAEHIPHETGPGHELLLGMRWTPDYGPVVTMGAGGLHTEFLARSIREDRSLALLSPGLAEPGAIERALGQVAVVRLVTEPQRGRPPLVAPDLLANLVRRFLELAAALVPDPVGEFEVNPLVLSGGRYVALDALLRFGPPPPPLPAPRPLAKIGRLLQPSSAAVMGVSEKMNPGRQILQNLLRDGFPPERITVVKPGLAEIDGVRCVPSPESLPERVDLLILSIPAAQAPEVIAAVAERGLAESVILIPGGLEEMPGSEPLVEHMLSAVAAAREREGGGPVINGGNCLGVRSVPGRTNTLFIPEHKMPLARGGVSPVAFLAGSGAFAVSKTNKLSALNPRYIVTIGNQMDLTAADYLEHLADDAEVEVFAVYLEGFRPLDGLRFLKAARRIVESGRPVILYRAGRTRAGAAAAASHTAAVAGDYAVTRRLAEAAGVVLAESIEDFEDLVRLFVLLRGHAAARDAGTRPAGVPGQAPAGPGLRLGALSNAGFECVAIADNLGAFTLAGFAPDTAAALQQVLERARVAGIVRVQNPMDLTPIVGDADYAAIARLVLADPGVDLGLVGCVPMTQALNTLEPGEGHPEDLAREGSIANRLVQLWRETDKPWVAVVDAGRIYDAMAHRLEDGGVPTFRTADRALRLLNRWANAVRPV